MENENDYHRYISDQIEEMQRYKWIESEKAGKDLGEAALLEWVKKYAKLFRESWQKIHGPISYK